MFSVCGLRRAEASRCAANAAGSKSSAAVGVVPIWLVAGVVMAFLPPRSTGPTQGIWVFDARPLQGVPRGISRTDSFPALIVMPGCRFAAPGMTIRCFLVLDPHQRERRAR